MRYRFGTAGHEIGQTQDDEAVSRGHGPRRIPAGFLPRGTTHTHKHTEAEVSAKLDGNSAEAGQTESD